MKIYKTYTAEEWRRQKRTGSEIPHSGIMIKGKEKTKHFSIPVPGSKSDDTKKSRGSSLRLVKKTNVD